MAIATISNNPGQTPRRETQKCGRRSCEGPEGVARQGGRHMAIHSTSKNQATSQLLKPPPYPLTTYSSGAPAGIGGCAFRLS